MNNCTPIKVLEKIFGGTKFKNCWNECIHFLEAFRLTFIGRKRQYEGKHVSSGYLQCRLNGAGSLRTKD